MEERQKSDQRPPKLPRELFQPSEEFVQSSEKLGLHWWHWDHVNKKMAISSSLMAILGYTAEEFDPRVPTIDKNIHPDDVQENLVRIRALISGKTDMYEMEYRVKGADGNWNWYYNRGLALARDDRGEAMVLGGISMDMSGQFEHLISRLQESEKFEFIFRNSDEAIMIIELRDGKLGRIIDANRAALDLFVGGKENLFNVIPGEMRDDPVLGEEGSLVKEVLEKGYAHTEKAVRGQDGQVRWLEFTSHAFTRTGEKLLIAIARDITSKRRTEAALRESERLYQVLVESAEDPIGLFDTQGKILLVNSAFYRTFGFEKEEFLETEWARVIHEDDRPLIREGAKVLMEMGHLTLDYRTIHKSGECMYVSSKSVLIRGEPGEKDMILTIIRDVTESRRTMQELEKAKEKAEESDKLKSAFLANMSHEIRTPMNSIVGFSNLLINPDLSEESRELYVSRIVRNAELLLTLISDIIDLAKIESGQLPIIYGKQKLSSLIEEIGQYAREEITRLGKDKLRVILEDDTSGCIIDTDVIRITQVIKNLVNNAIKFTEKGSITIGCKEYPEKESVVLFVKDTGIGIDESDYELIFDQFRQLDSSNTRKFGGTGLGLAICKNLVGLLGGSIWVESTPGKGSVFRVMLPMQPVGRFEAGRQEEPSHVSVGGKLDKLNILVVEDEEDSLMLFTEILKGLGHDVHGVLSALEALQYIEEEGLPDLVFMDVQLPVLSGTECMRILKQRYENIRVVAQSAHALVGDRSRFMEEGFDSYLPKPFTEDQLNDVMRSLFGQ